MVCSEILFVSLAEIGMLYFIIYIDSIIRENHDFLLIIAII